MTALFASCKYRFLAVFSLVGILGIGINYFFPGLERDFFILLFWFGGASLFLAIVLSLEESGSPEEMPGKNNHA